MRKRQLIGILVALLILAVTFMIEPTEQLPLAARNTLGVVLMVIVLLVTEAVPLGIVCLTSVALMYFLGCVDSVGGALTGFTNKTLFFLLASFGISQALTVVPASKRLLVMLMGKFGKSINALLFGVMACTALLSSVISNVAAAAVFVPIVLEFLNVYDNDDDRKRTGKAFMIGLPVASMIGGMMTPAGSSINILVISMLETHTGMTIPFVDWMIMGIPLSLALLPLSWGLFVKIYCPAPLAPEKIEGYVRSVQQSVPKRITGKELYVIVVLLVLLALWILSSWIPFLEITPVAILGLLLYFLPGKMQVLTWKDFCDSVSLEAFLIMGTMISIGSVVSATGLSQWIAGVIFPAGFPAVLPLVIAFVAVVTFLLLVLIPVAPAVVTMLSAPLIMWCVSLGVSPALVMVAFGLCSCNCYLLPLDTVPLITYATGYYDMFDMPKTTAIIQGCIVVLCALWLSVCGIVL